MWLVQNDSVNGKSSPSSAVAALPGQDSSPLTDAPVLSKLAVHSDTIGQQFKSPRLQQLLGNRTAAAGSMNPTATVKSGDSMIPAETDADVPQVGATEQIDNNDEAVATAEV